MSCSDEEGVVKYAKKYSITGAQTLSTLLPGQVITTAIYLFIYLITHTLQLKFLGPHERPNSNVNMKYERAKIPNLEYGIFNMNMEIEK